MDIRSQLSNVLREAKYKSGYTYKDLQEGTGCSLTSIRYALNGGTNVGFVVFQRLIDYMEIEVQIHLVKQHEYDL